MTRLEDIVSGIKLTGLVGDTPVTVMTTTWHGNAVLEITFQDGQGELKSQLLYRQDEPRLTVVDPGLPWSYTADAHRFRLVSEAYRIQLAHLFDPYLAIHKSALEPLPHQIAAVYHDMLPRQPLRYLLADDPGAGKTIMTGLLITELLARGDIKRCLIVAPGSLELQWQNELQRKFNLQFELLTDHRQQLAPSRNVLADIPLCLARLDQLARNEDLIAQLKTTRWDLIVCDEAHKMSATVWGREVKYTKRFKLGRLLSAISRHFLLLTATPHNGKEEEFQLFMSLIDPDRFLAGSGRNYYPADIKDLMRRRLKEELLRFDGTPLFPERFAYTVNYDLSDLEAQLYAAVTDYVRQEFDRAEQLTKKRKTNVAFALITLQRRLASSPEAIYQSLNRRRQRLQMRLAEEEAGKRLSRYLASVDADYDDDDLPAREREQTEEKLVDWATAAQTKAELKAEIAILRRLEQLANQLRTSGQDRKWEELSQLLQDNEKMFDSHGLRQKLIIFTEHRATLRYLSAKIRSLLGENEAVVTIHGGLSQSQRRKVEKLFQQDPGVRILVATDAAGEGINLQRAHLMVNYDLPWNPNRLEQRFGRIHRIGQTEVCHLWNLVAAETREGMVFQRLLEKLEQQRETLSGKVFDVLGKLTFANRSLRDLLLDAVRYGNDPKVKSRLHEELDQSLNQKALQGLLTEPIAIEQAMDANEVMALAADIQRHQARRLQPHFIEAFFIEAFAAAGGKISPRERGRFQITFIPPALRKRCQEINPSKPIPQPYQRVCFDKSYCQLEGQPPADLIAPGHPLLTATVQLMLERYSQLLKQGTILIDDHDFDTEARSLVYLETTIQDGVTLPSGKKRVLAQQVHFLELTKDGLVAAAGPAPHLDYRAPTLTEQEAIHSFLAQQQPWQQQVEARALSYAEAELIPAELASVRERRLKLIDRSAKAVKQRLTAEIQYWDFKAADLKAKEAAGYVNARLNSVQAARRAEALATRLERRLARLEQERHISARLPLLTGRALVIPHGLLARLIGPAGRFTVDAGARREIELAALKTVMAIETDLGFIPRDLSAAKVGYDVESTLPQAEGCPDKALVRFIEVKGRAKGAATVTVTKNEIITALNAAEQYILALVEVDGKKTRTVYLKYPFRERPDFAATSVNYDIDRLLKRSQIILERG